MSAPPSTNFNFKIFYFIPYPLFIHELSLKHIYACGVVFFGEGQWRKRGRRQDGQPGMWLLEQ